MPLHDVFGDETVNEETLMSKKYCRGCPPDANCKHPAPAVVAPKWGPQPALHEVCVWLVSSSRVFGFLSQFSSLSLGCVSSHSG